uniref:Protease adaptor n=1 Tax=Siphoviridae sp. ctKcB20 TaxID=2827568 RepID=A0A8S5LLG9_9CAUD|nr:MAG TPA: protease adaptor [Siphoviridae sp. ctKcB20]
MSKFKVGDKVAPVDTPNVYFGCIASIGHGSAFVKIPPNYDSGFVVSLVSLALYQELPNMSDDEIYNMLEPKMKNSNVWDHGYRVVAYNDGYHLVREDNDVINAIALAYRSGYLRAKKGRPFKIGGEEE